MKRVYLYLAKMADASLLRAKKMPDNLYELCLTNLVNYLQKSKCERNDLRSLPDSILMDVYYKKMPYKIVQTHEKGKPVLTAVPSEWERDGTLFWPKNRAEKLLRLEFSHPEDNWIPISCTIKRSNLKYQEAENEITLMQYRSDTEEEQQPRRPNETSILTCSLNELANQCFMMLTEKRLCILGAELSELDIFERLLRFAGSQLRLLQCFQAVIEHGSKLSSELAGGYLARCDAGTRSTDSLIYLGLRLGGFLNEAGWYADAQRVLLRCREMCQAQPQTTYYKRLTLECCHRLLNTQSAYCCFPAAAKTYGLALQLLGIPDDVSGDMPEGPYAVGDKCSQELQTDNDNRLEHAQLEEEECLPALVVGRAGHKATWGMQALVARLCKEFSSLYFVRCDYSAAHAWAMRALRLLTPHTPAKITIEVLRACGKACVVKRRFSRAGLLVRQAVALARRAFGAQHPRYAAALLDYGFYLLNIDSINHSVAVYEEALATLRRVFGRSSLHVATAQEDLAYALYVLEYSSGRFYKARDHAERAIRIIENLVPGDHLLLASAKRVKALILEEIALDTPPGQDMSEPSLLEESEALHKAALALSMMAFGEKNVQTAKHYGNLGRLYQSMHKFQDAETMHLKAIAIKEELLGPEDYEVGLSIGHLASLYNYHMNMHYAAEKLYLRSISISLKLFGERYSGLEYDYRGLVHVFTQLKRHDRADHYTRLLQHWHDLREQSKQEQQPAIGEEQVMPLELLRTKMFAPND